MLHSAGDEPQPYHQDVAKIERMSPFGRRVAALCGLVVFMDGFDTQAIGYVAPALVRAMNVPRAALGPVFAAGLFGLMIGALAFGPVADRFGRRPVLLGCTFWFGAFTMATAAAGSLNLLLAFRFLTGLGLGGALPNAVALTSEYAPSRVRATAVMVMFCGFSLGAALGGVAAAALITGVGWRSVFVVGGIVPLAMLFPLVTWLPESTRYLAVHGGQMKARPGRVTDLFTDGRAALTSLLWIVFFMSLLDLYFVSNWLPTVVNDAGATMNRAALVTSMYQGGGTIGTVALGRLFDKRAPFRSLGVTYLVASVLVLVIGRVNGAALVAIVFGAGFCVVGGQIGANALAANAYPTSIRATGVGWSLGIGRLGSIAGPVLGGLLLSSRWGVRDVFLAAAIPLVIAATAAISIDLFFSVRHGQVCETDCRTSAAARFSDSSAT